MVQQQQQKSWHNRKEWKLIRKTTKKAKVIENKESWHYKK